MMSKEIMVDGKVYLLVKNYRDAFVEEMFLERYTSYFSGYDYIVGDIAYNKLRLKGFYDDKNKKVKEFNNYRYLEKYLKENCAVSCKYFVLKKKND